MGNGELGIGNWELGIGNWELGINITLEKLAFSRKGFGRKAKHGAKQHSIWIDILGSKYLNYRPNATIRERFAFRPYCSPKCFSHSIGAPSAPQELLRNYFRFYSNRQGGCYIMRKRENILVRKRC
ncbi:MAG: hypothetical protein F6K47_01040 [Symploca sp. SIO2E6]|nr:hypothetical protein [Symploca sp. SIO2E6]